MSATPDAEDRRLATLHLRLGGLALARSEWEDLDRRTNLDAAGLADLAEARWRTGGLASAGVAAAGHLAAGGTRPIARMIAAEAAAAAGDQTEARTHAAAIGMLEPEALDHLFAGMPRRAFWPSVNTAPGGPPDADGSVEPGRAQAGHVTTAIDLPAAEPPDHLARAREELGSGIPSEADRGLQRLSLVLRLAPNLAPEVLGLLGVSGSRREVAAHLVRGDAFRLLGRHLDAEAALAAAARELDVSGPVRP